VGYIIGSIFVLTGIFNPYIFSINVVYLSLSIISLLIFSNRVFNSLQSSEGFRSFIRYTLYLLPLFPLQTFCYIIDLENWRLYLAIMISIGALSDSIGWLVGKNWGKHKLYPKVSPNKTVEGAIGAVAGCGLVIAAYFYISQGKSILPFFAIFSFLAAIGVVGDLWQSRLKRLFNLKDSSQLIPGHGGVYDRMDSHIFIAPFFLQLILIFPNLY
jgi:phosphatidate cytidylyltransferase